MPMAKRYRKNCHNCLKKVILRDILLLELKVCAKFLKVVGSAVNKIFLEGKEKHEDRLIVRKSKSNQFLGSRLRY